MRINRVGAALSVALACAAITFASCDNNASDPDATGTPGANNGGKGSHVLTQNPLTTVQIDRTQLGNTQVTANDVGALTVNGLGGVGSGISSTFAPATHWRQTADISLPAAGGGQVQYATYSAGTLQSTLQINQGVNTPTSLTLTPSFSQAQVGTNFDIEVYDEGQMVAVQRNVNTGPTVTRPCAELLNILRNTNIDFLVKTGYINICEWRLLFNSICCKPRVVLTDGTSVNATEVRFIELPSPSGPYVYTSSDEVRVTGNVGTYTIQMETAGG